MMKYSQFLFSLIIYLFCAFTSAQTADDIINAYLEETGGIDNWRSLEATKMIAEVDYEGMTLPLTIYNTKEGKQAVKINYDGQEVTQLAYDGEVLWVTNSNMKPQKADEESTKNMKYSKNDFPTPFLDYKEKNYIVKLIGKEKANGKDTHKILLIQEPITIEGLEEDSVSYYYFDTKTHLLIMVETEIKGGPMDGQFSVSTMENYKKVKGLYFPFLLNENGSEIKIEKVILNPEINEKVFAFPKQ